jgi:hypothetical protein
VLVERQCALPAELEHLRLRLRPPSSTTTSSASNDGHTHECIDWDNLSSHTNAQSGIARSAKISISRNGSMSGRTGADGAEMRREP